MSLGRATLPKMLAFAGIGLVAGAWLAFSGSGQQWFGPLSVLFLAAFGGYVGWLLLVKNKTLRKATPAQIAEAQRFLPVAERGVVYLYRHQVVGMLMGLEALVDGRPVGQTRGKTFYRLELAPGRHVFAGNGKCPQPLELDIAAGQVAYIEQELQMGMLQSSYRYRAEPDAQRAQSAIRGCRMLLPA